jgi:hypothetical protein
MSRALFNTCFLPKIKQFIYNVNFLYAN